MNILSEEIKFKKQAAFDTLVNVLRKADMVAGEKGLRKGLEFLEKYKSPLNTLSKGQLNKPIYQKAYGKNTKFFEKFILEQIGDMAHGLNRVTKGVSQQTPLLKNVKMVGKNFAQLLGDQVRGSMYKVVSPEDVKLVKNRKAVQGKGLFKHKMFDRPIVGKTTRGDYIIKKRKAMIPLSIATTPVGLGVGTALFDYDKKDNAVSRTGKALAETAKWSLVPPIATAELIYRTIK